MHWSVERIGSASDRLVFVHGSLSVGRDAFGAQLPLAERYTLDIVTRRGYGATIPIGAVDVGADARDIVEILGAGAHLVGTSMGGVVAMNAAGLRPDLVRSLTVIEPPAFALASDLPEVRQVSDAMKRHWSQTDPAPSHAFVSGFVSALGMEMALPDPLPPALFAAARNLVTERPWRVDVPVGAIADAPFPKLVVTGGWSPAFDAICSRLSTIFGVELHTLRGAGHGVQKVGDQFNELLVDHIETTTK